MIKFFAVFGILVLCGIFEFLIWGVGRLLLDDDEFALIMTNTLVLFALVSYYFL